MVNRNNLVILFQTGHIIELKKCRPTLEGGASLSSTFDRAHSPCGG